jgi:Rrf2 family protein
VLITREVDYAVRCVLEVARNGHTSTAEVAANAGIPLSILGRLVSATSKAGILQTRRGAKGGIRLARDPSEITMLEVIEAVNGPLTVNLCSSDPGYCEVSDGCPIMPVCAEATRQLEQVFSISFDQLVGTSDWKQHLTGDGQGGDLP